jgi:hypothetical protein
MIVLVMQIPLGMFLLAVIWLWLFRELFNTNAMFELERLQTTLFVDCVKNGWLQTAHYAEADAFVSAAYKAVPILSAWDSVLILFHAIRQNSDSDHKENGNATPPDVELKYFKKFDLHVIRILVDCVVKHSLILRVFRMVYRLTIESHADSLNEASSEDLREPRAPKVRRLIYKHVAPTAGHHHGCNHLQYIG